LSHLFFETRNQIFLFKGSNIHKRGIKNILQNQIPSLWLKKKSLSQLTHISLLFKELRVKLIVVKIKSH